MIPLENSWRNMLLAILGPLARELCYSLYKAGCSPTVSLLDHETQRLWDAPVHTPA